MSTNLAWNVTNQFKCDPVRPGKTDELIPIPGDNICNVKPDHESHRNFTGKPEIKKSKSEKECLVMNFDALASS